MVYKYGYSNDGTLNDYYSNFSMSLFKTADFDDDGRPDEIEPAFGANVTECWYNIYTTISLLCIWSKMSEIRTCEQLKWLTLSHLPLTTIGLIQLEIFMLSIQLAGKIWYLVVPEIMHTNSYISWFLESNQAKLKIVKIATWFYWVFSQEIMKNATSLTPSSTSWTVFNSQY